MRALRDRLGLDLGGRVPIEDSLAWAGRHGIHYVDCSLEGGTAPNAPHLMTEARTTEIRRLCERHEIHLGLHTLSAVNVAETAPFVGEATDAYLRTYIDLAARLGVGWFVVQDGFRFWSDCEGRGGA